VTPTGSTMGEGSAMGEGSGRGRGVGAVTATGLDGGSTREAGSEGTGRTLALGSSGGKEPSSSSFAVAVACSGAAAGASGEVSTAGASEARLDDGAATESFSSRSSSLTGAGPTLPMPRTSVGEAGFGATGASGAEGPCVSLTSAAIVGVSEGSIAA